MDVKQFENNRWQREDQKLEFRHKVALSMVPFGTVLDLGSGDGLLLSLLKDKGIEGKGLDLSEEGVTKANNKGLRTQVFDFGNRPLPFSDNFFDTVIMLDILEHLYDPLSVLKEAQRVSKNQIIVGVPNFSSLPARIQTLLGKVPENNQPKKGHVYWFNKTVLFEMFKKADIQIERIDVNTNFSSVPLLGFIIKTLSKIFPNLFSLSFVVLGKK